jgi:hypothetical protein
MSRREVVRGYRIAFALIGIFTMTYLFIHNYNNSPDFRPANYFSFFTIQTNILVAVVLLIAGLTSLGERPTRTFDSVRGAAVAYIALVGVVYGVLLSGYQAELQTNVHWADTVVHKIIPIVMVVDWLLAPPSREIQFRKAYIWMVYPLVYLAYTLIRGPQVDWWPYPFLNPHHESQGYGAVALYSIGIAVAFFLFVWLTTLLSRRAPDEPAAA